MLLALAAKNYFRSYCNGYGFDAIFRASLYLGLLPLVYAPATPLVLILPLAILLFRRTFREVVAAAAGLILPVLTACYVSWGAGEEFTAPVTALADAVVSGVPLWIFTALPLPSLVMLCIIAALALTALFFFLSDIYAAGTKPRFILIFNIGILAMTLALLCTPSVTPEAFTLTAVPAALLFPVLFVRIDRRIALIDGCRIHSRRNGEVRRNHVAIFNAVNRYVFGQERNCRKSLDILKLFRIARLIIETDDRIIVCRTFNLLICNIG